MGKTLEDTLKEIQIFPNGSELTDKVTVIPSDKITSIVRSISNMAEFTKVEIYNEDYIITLQTSCGETISIKRDVSESDTWINGYAITNGQSLVRVTATSEES